MFPTTSHPFDTVTRWFRANTVRSYVFHYENVLGTSLELRLQARSAADAAQAEQSALAEIDRLERIFSVFDQSSEFRQWQERRGTPVRLSSELTEVLRSCKHWQERSAGAFHPASEALAQIWRAAVTRNLLPTQHELDAVRERIAAPLWEHDPNTGQTTCLTECPLTLNAVAKGYIVDRACEAALGAGDTIRGVTLNIGGDLRLRGAHTETVGITDPACDAENAPPISRISVRNNAVATSGDWRRGFQIDGGFYSHILDPRTGMPATAGRSASVLAPNAADADALATIFSVLAPDQSLALADSLPQVGCLLITPEGAVHRNAHWRAHELSTTLKK